MGDGYIACDKEWQNFGPLRTSLLFPWRDGGRGDGHKAMADGRGWQNFGLFGIFFPFLVWLHGAGERDGLVVRASDYGSKGPWFKARSGWSSWPSPHLCVKGVRNIAKGSIQP